jgi:hypothetical protein
MLDEDKCSREREAQHTMRTATRGGFGIDSILKIRGLLIWYGVLEMRASHGGIWGILMTSPRISSSFLARGVPWTRLVTSAPILGSSSTGQVVRGALQEGVSGRLRTRYDFLSLLEGPDGNWMDCQS